MWVRLFTQQASVGPCTSSVVSIALPPGESQMNKTVSAQKKPVAVCGGESRVPRTSARCGQHHSQDTRKGKRQRKGRDEKAAGKAKPKLSTEHAGLTGRASCENMQRHGQCSLNQSAQVQGGDWRRSEAGGGGRGRGLRKCISKGTISLEWRHRNALSNLLDKTSSAGHGKALQTGCYSLGFQNVKLKCEMPVVCERDILLQGQ